MTNLYAKIEQAVEYIESHADQQPDLEKLAARFDLSPHYFQREFKRLVGITPKRFLQYTTLNAAKQALSKKANLLDVSFAVGLSGPGRLHDLFISGEAVTPGNFKSGGEGVQITYGIHETPFGYAGLALTQHGICELDFRLTEAQVRDRLAEVFAHTWPQADVHEDASKTEAFIAQMFASGQQAVANMPLHLRGTNFQLKVWQALLGIPEGALSTYSAIAEAVDSPKAVRAVGSAVGDNPISFLIPCHRVLRKDGGIGGYASGLPRKRVMLAYESLSTQK